jgi:hypothetical protein
MRGCHIRCVRLGGEPAVQLTTGALRLVALASRGPRIASLARKGGESILYWAPGKHRRGSWNPLGGHRLWTTRPGADECEETYRPDNQLCRLERSSGGFSLTAPVDPVTRLERGIRIQALEPERLSVEHSIRNASDMLWSGGAWGVTVTLPTARSVYLAPLGSDAPWDVATVTVFNRWGDDRGGRGFHDSQFEISDDALVLRPGGRENKRALGARPGILALHDPLRDVLFAKHAAFDARASYPGAANLALYAGSARNFYVELETMSPLVTLQPGETLKHVETWVLTRASSRQPSARSLGALFASRR